MDAETVAAVTLALLGLVLLVLWKPARSARAAQLRSIEGQLGMRASLISQLGMQLEKRSRRMELEKPEAEDSENATNELPVALVEHSRRPLPVPERDVAWLEDLLGQFSSGLTFTGTRLAHPDAFRTEANDLRMALAQARIRARRTERSFDSFEKHLMKSLFVQQAHTGKVMALHGGHQDSLLVERTEPPGDH